MPLNILTNIVHMSIDMALVFARTGEAAMRVGILLVFFKFQHVLLEDWESMVANPVGLTKAGRPSNIITVK